MDDKIFDSSFLKKLDKLSIYTKNIMTSGNSGLRKSKAKGTSIEFSERREYSDGDDFRRIDWNAYARSEKFFVKLFMEERETLVNIFIDNSKSMDFGESRKNIFALRMAAALSYMSLSNLDSVCINHEKFRGSNSFNNLLRTLTKVEFQGEYLVNSLKSQQLKGRGISVIISDFLNDENVEDAVKWLKYSKQDIIIIHVLDREEAEPKLEGRLKIIDSESKKNVDVFITEKILNLYKKKLEAFTNNIERIAKKYEAAYIKCMSDEDIEKIIFYKIARR